MYRDQFGEFVCGYWGLKVKNKLKRKNCKKKQKTNKQTKKQNKRKAVLHLTLSIATIVFLQNTVKFRK